MEAAETKQVLQESPKEETTKVQVSDLIELSQIEQNSEESIGTLKNILSMLESKEETEKSLEDIRKIDAGNCVESQDVSSSVCIKNPETIDEPEEVDKVEAKVTVGILVGLKSRIIFLKVLMFLKMKNQWTLKVTLMVLKSRIICL